jgi:catechol 2,3-dioxygenase-like lactoylglutathione lyase family enzyme
MTSRSDDWERGTGEMAYRFLLEVPETLAAEAGVAVSQADDAQVVVVRSSHGRGADEPFADLTIAAHSLRVIQSLYDWFDDLGASRPDIRLVLHGGERLQLEANERSAMVAAIRRDQPWVDRSIPKIGDHEEETFNGGEEAAMSAGYVSSPGASTATLERTWQALPAVHGPEDGRKIAIRELNHIAIRVTDLHVAERFYASFLSMDIVGRARRGTGGGFESLDATYSWTEATVAGEEADVTFLRNGPLVLALQRLGRGARLERGLLDHVSVRVDATTFTTLKGQVLMRSMEVVGSAETAFAFKDPIGITWEITLQSVPEFL